MHLSVKVVPCQKRLFCKLLNYPSVRFISLSNSSNSPQKKSSADLSTRFDEENYALFGPVRNSSNKRYKTVTKEHERKSPEHFKTSSTSELPLQSNIAKFPSTFSSGDGDILNKLDFLKANPIKSSSISRILNQTMSEESKVALNKWRKEKIKELGEEGFAVYQAGLFERGKMLHKAIFNYLSGLCTLKQADISPENEGYWKSLQHVFPRISEPTVLEKPVTHPYLKYHGIVDCVCKLNGNVVVLDWKTSSRKKIIIEHLHDNPVQVSAYIGAINFDSAFVSQDLHRGAVVVAYDTGMPADIFDFESRNYWNIWLQKLSVYHSANDDNTSNIT